MSTSPEVSRRGFLKTGLAAGAWPARVWAGSISATTRPSARPSASA